MENTRPTILWALDSQSNKITTLPPGPLLLPAVLFLCVLWLIEKLWPTRNKKEPLPNNFNHEEWWQNYREYHRILDLRRAGKPLSLRDEYLMNCKLPNPSWAKPGEWWTY